mmetsp:Transcript_4862/g.12110  ORF Transcript_4862/g.12110 Transcript_4862/m.12110 type:complete len:789 (+) Transcript_4862:88-2454(+)
MLRAGVGSCRVMRLCAQRSRARLPPSLAPIQPHSLGSSSCGGRVHSLVRTPTNACWPSARVFSASTVAATPHRRRSAVDKRIEKELEEAHDPELVIPMSHHRPRMPESIRSRMKAAQTLVESKSLEEANQEYQEAFRIARSEHNPIGEYLCLQAMSKLEMDRSSYMNAAYHLKAAIDIFDQQAAIVRAAEQVAERKHGRQQEEDDGGDGGDGDDGDDDDADDREDEDADKDGVPLWFPMSDRQQMRTDLLACYLRDGKLSEAVKLWNDLREQSDVSMHHRRNVMSPASLPTQMLVNLGHAYITLDDPHRAIDHFAKAAADARSAYNRDRAYAGSLWKALSGLGHAHIVAGDHAVALEKLMEAAGLAEEVEDMGVLSDTFYLLGLLRKAEGHPPQAERYWTQAVRGYLKLENPLTSQQRYMFDALIGLADMADSREDFDRAFVYYKRALASALEAKKRPESMKAFVKVVDVLDKAKKFDEAARFQKQMVDYVSEGSDVPIYSDAVARIDLGKRYRGLARPIEAEGEFRTAASISEHLGKNILQAKALHELSSLLILLHRFGDAQKEAKIALRLIQDDPHSGEPLAEHLGNLALVDSMTGSHKSALDLAQRACEEANKTHDRESIARALHVHGTVLSEAGESDDALAALNKSYHIFKDELKNDRGVGLLSGALGHCHMNLKDYEKATTFFRNQLRLASAHHDKWQITDSVRNLAWCAFHTNDHQRALELFQRHADDAFSLGQNPLAVQSMRMASNSCRIMGLSELSDQLSFLAEQLQLKSNITHRDRPVK